MRSRNYMKIYYRLAEDLKEEIKENIRLEWLADVTKEIKITDDYCLVEIKENLMENTDNCKAWLEEQIEPENTMFIRALRKTLRRKIK